MTRRKLNTSVIDMFSIDIIQSLSKWLDGTLKKLDSTGLASNDVYIGRPSKWGNPFRVSRYGRKKAIKLFEDYLISSPLMTDLHELKGKTLVCHCYPDSCHGDILLKYMWVLCMSYYSSYIFGEFKCCVSALILLYWFIYHDCIFDQCLTNLSVTVPFWLLPAVILNFCHCNRDWTWWC